MRDNSISHELVMGEKYEGECVWIQSILSSEKDYGTAFWMITIQSFHFNDEIQEENKKYDLVYNRGFMMKVSDRIFDYTRN